MTRIKKALSANDLGLTGSHQAGIAVPKERRVLSFFPTLDAAVKNPRVTLVMRERGDGRRWEFNFIYYNGKFFGGTRNEFRLTGMTKFLRSLGASVGDHLCFEKSDEGSILIDIERISTRVRDDGVLVLSGGWKVAA